MSVSALTSAFYHSESKYTTRLVLLAIANFDNPLGSFPSLDTIGRLSGGVNRRTVQRAIDELVQMGELTEVTRNGTTNLYRLTISCPENCDGSTSHKPLTEGGGLQTTGGSQTTGGGGLQTTGGVVSRPPKPNTNEIDNSIEFDEFWEHYPKKADKGVARRAFKSARKKTDFETLLNSVKDYAVSVKGKEKRYIKNPATWLNAEAWENEDSQPNKEEGGSFWDSIS